jgi:hypothetical protein
MLLHLTVGAGVGSLLAGCGGGSSAPPASIAPVQGGLTETAGLIAPGLPQAQVYQLLREKHGSFSLLEGAWSGYHGHEIYRLPGGARLRVTYIRTVQEGTKVHPNQPAEILPENPSADAEP